MPLTTAGNYSTDIPPNLVTRLEELATFSMHFGDGATAATNIAITGIKTTATIKKAFHVRSTADTAMPVFTDLTSECSVTSAGNIQFASTATNTANTKILVFYFNS